MRYLGFVIGGLVAAVSFAAGAEAAQPAAPAPDDGVAKPAVQELKPGSPEWVAREYLTAVREHGFSAEADFMHPDEIDRFKAMLIPVFAAESESGGRALMNATFGRDARLTDVRLAAPADFLRRFTRVMAVRVPDQPTSFDRLFVLGSVKEDDQVHVLVRLSSGGQSVAEESLEVVSLLPDDGGWKLMLSPKLEAAVRAMDLWGTNRRAEPRLIPTPEPPPPASQPPEAALPGITRPQRNPAGG